MYCQSKNTEDWEKCCGEATVRVTIIKARTHSKCLCKKHRDRYVARYRYRAKFCDKPCEIIEEKLEGVYTEEELRRLSITSFYENKKK